MMKKMLCLILMLSLLLTVAGCAQKDGAAPMDDALGLPGSALASNGSYAAPVSSDIVVDSGSMTAEDTLPATEGTTAGAFVDMPASTTAAMTWAADLEAEAAEKASATMAAGKKSDGMFDVAMPAPGEPYVEPKPEIQVGAGMLTAGEWKDLEDIPFWTKLLRDNNWYKLMENRTLFANHIVPVKVSDGDGNACFNVPVTLLDEKGAVLYTARTDIDGMAYLLYGLDGKEQTAQSVVVGQSVYPVSADGETVTVSGAAGVKATALDLLFMIDTTGSMTDELSYLQAELRDVIRRVAKSGEAFTIQLSVNFYRDNGDEYVVRSFEFTSDIDKAISQLSQQQANGGGDYAEAVHLALQDIVDKHQWRDSAVKLCFMVLDAPPHKEREISGIDRTMRASILKMAEQGIRLIPVASSGVDTETEFLLRNWAVMTGGTYTFLTNHSGIGNSHLEPTIGAYEVEKLNDLLVRVISEYCGLK